VFVFVSNGARYFKTYRIKRKIDKKGKIGGLVKGKRESAVGLDFLFA
jgi:hypothetical protein